MRVPALALVVATVASAGCSGGEQASAPPAAGAPAATVPEGLPSPVAKTWKGIQGAAEAGAYEQLRPYLDPDAFLSDFGFSSEPLDIIGGWKEMGPEPLDQMGAILRMPYAVTETNEGTLYQWPRFDPDSTAEDVSAAERESFLTIMSEDELVNAFIPEYGYTGPRLGILADGTWWFFLSGGAP